MASFCAFLCSAASNNTRILDDGAQTITRKEYLSYVTNVVSDVLYVLESKIVFPNDVGKIDYSILLCDRKSLQRASVDEKTRYIKTTISDKSEKRGERVSIRAVSYTF